MNDVISTLKKLVSEANDEKSADVTISDMFPKIGEPTAINIRKDVQDVINGIMSEAELSYYLENKYGLI